MKTIKTKITYTIISLLIVFWFYGLFSFYYKGLNEPPLIYAAIPKETIDFFKSLIISGSDIHINFNPDPDPSGWIDSNNIGEDSQYGYKKIEDENFIVYFNNSISELEKAKKTLLFCNEAIPQMADLFGKFIYAKNNNKKKLPIYLANSRSDFNKLYLIYSEGVKPSEGIIGVFFSDISVLGLLSKAIIIAPEPWEINENKAKEVIRHEVSHFNYLSQINFGKIKEKPTLNWVTEGLAEYFADSKERIKEIRYDKLNSYHLNNNINPEVDSYWVGYTVFNFMKETDSYQVESIKKFISESYIKSPVNALTTTTNVSTNTFEQQWKNYLEAFRK